MKKLKILLIILSICFLTGCSASYNLNINDTSIKETVNLSMNNSEYNEFFKDNNNKYINMYYDDENNFAEDGSILPLPKVTYYNFSKNDSSNTVSFTGTFDYDSYNRSTIRTMGFKTTKFLVTDNKLSFATSAGFTFPHDELTKLTINITSPYKVITSNADKTSGNTSTWTITKDNSSSKYIFIEYEKETKNNDETNKEENKEEVKTDDNTPIEKEKLPIKLILMIISLILLIGFMISLVFIYKFKKNNNV